MIIFLISMPNVGSWNGRWAGEGKLYAKSLDIRNKEKKEKLLSGSPYSYSWDDGWSAKIDVIEAEGNDAQKIMRKSNGFLGYDWMVDSIVKHGLIKE